MRQTKINFSYIVAESEQDCKSMAESCIERMEKIGAKRKIADFIVKEKQPYDFKVRYAQRRAEQKNLQKNVINVI